jgi:RNA polymerase sigma-70 factor, ECF subfamily
MRQAKDMDEEPGDTTLLRAVAAREEAALKELFDRHAPWLSLRVWRRCNDAEIVDDVISDTFVAVWNGAGSFRGDGEVAAWMWGIASRRLVSRMRGRLVPEPWADEDLERRFEPLASAEEQVLLNVEHGDVGVALRSLSPELRAVVQATILDGLSTREAARLLGLPHGTLKGRLRKAKRQMRESLATGYAADGMVA